MISTFNGYLRTLGEGESEEFRLAIEARMRDYLHLFRGSSLNVFICIALHIDQYGWSWPTVETIMAKTGKSDDTVYRALNLLETLYIDGKRLMLRTTEKPSHVPPEKLTNKKARNFYLVFPSKEEIALYSQAPGPDEGDKNLTPQKRDTKNLTSQKGDTKSNQHKDEELPFSKERTHTARAPSPVERRPAGGGGSRFEKDECIEWARYRRDVEGAKIEPEAVGRARWRDGTDDDEIERYFTFTKPALEAARLKREREAAERQREQEALDDWPPPPPESERAPEAARLWESATATLAGNLPQQIFATWFSPIIPIRLADGALVLYAPNFVVREWIDANYSTAIEDALLLVEHPGAEPLSYRWYIAEDAARDV